MELEEAKQKTKEDDDVSIFPFMTEHTYTYLKFNKNNIKRTDFRGFKHFGISGGRVTFLQPSANASHEWRWPESLWRGTSTRRG